MGILIYSFLNLSVLIELICWFKEITAHYLLTSHICYDYMQPPFMSAYIASLCARTFTVNMFLLVTSAAKGTDGFLRCRISVIHLNWSHVIRVPFDGRDNPLFLH